MCHHSNHLLSCNFCGPLPFQWEKAQGVHIIPYHNLKVTGKYYLLQYKAICTGARRILKHNSLSCTHTPVRTPSAISLQLLRHSYSGLDCVHCQVSFLTGQGHWGTGSTYLPQHHHLVIKLLLFTLNRLHTLLRSNQSISPHPLTCTIRGSSQKTEKEGSTPTSALFTFNFMHALWISCCNDAPQPIHNLL